MGVAAGAGRERSWAAGGQTRRRRRRSRAGKALRGGSGMERCGAPPYTTPTPPALHDEIPPGVKPVPAPPPHFPHGRTGARSRRFGTGPYGGGGPVEGARGRPPHATPELAAIPRSLSRAAPARQVLPRGTGVPLPLRGSVWSGGDTCCPLSRPHAGALDR